MARINNFIYCMNSITADTESNALGIISAITPDYIPGAFSFSIFCSILDLEEGMHTINMQFINPKEEIIANLEGPIPYEENQEIDIPQKYRGINISSNWQNVLLKEVHLIPRRNSQSVFHWHMNR